MDIKLGSSYTVEANVNKEDTALAQGSGEIEVFATPRLVSIMEKAAVNAVSPYIDEGYTTVGTRIDIKHIAATPIGMKAKAYAELLEVDGKRLVFKVEAFDEVEKIGEGIHERYIVNIDRFLNKAKGKL